MDKSDLANGNLVQKGESCGEVAFSIGDPKEVDKKSLNRTNQ